MADNRQIVNPKGEMKGSAITGPVGKEAAELWPVSGSIDLILQAVANDKIAYCQQLWCRDVKRGNLCFSARERKEARNGRKC